MVVPSGSTSVAAVLLESAMANPRAVTRAMLTLFRLRLANTARLSALLLRRPKNKTSANEFVLPSCRLCGA